MLAESKGIFFDFNEKRVNGLHVSREHFLNTVTKSDLFVKVI